MESIIIAARAKNGVIGKNGQLPWHFSEDLKRFKRLTLGNIVVMGRATFESIGRKPLPERTNVVLTTRPNYGVIGIIPCSSIEEALALGKHYNRDVFFAGGARVYEEALPVVNRLELTEIHADYGGDTYFPRLDLSAWEQKEKQSLPEFDFVTYRRR